MEVKSLKKNVGNASPFVNRIFLLFLHNLRPLSSVLRRVSISSTSEEVRDYTVANLYATHSTKFPLIPLPKKCVTSAIHNHQEHKRRADFQSFH